MINEVFRFVDGVWVGFAPEVNNILCNHSLIHKETQEADIPAPNS